MLTHSHALSLEKDKQLADPIIQALTESLEKRDKFILIDDLVYHKYKNSLKFIVSLSP